MTRDEMLPERHDCSGDAAAYVLGALDPDEVREFERHLAECVVCRDEVGALREAAEVLPLTAARYAAPPELRRRVVRALRSEPAPARPEPAPRLRYRLSDMFRPALGLGAALAAAIVAVVVALSSGNGGGPRVIQASLNGWSGSAQVRLSGGRGTLLVSHMPPPPSGHIYEVWLLLRGRSAPSPTSTLFSVTSSGQGEIGLPGNLRGVSAVLVTPEPAGGSLVPTHQPIIVARLT